MSSSLTQATPMRLQEQEGDEELSAWVVLNYAVITDSDGVVVSMLAHRLQQYCVLNQILEFHGIVQSQVGRLAALKEFLHVQRQDLLNDQPKNDHVEVYVDIVQRTFQSLGRICQELRNAANVLRLPSRRRFPYCSHVDHVRLQTRASIGSHCGLFHPSRRIGMPLCDLEKRTLSVSPMCILFCLKLVEAFSLMPTQKAITNIPEGCASRKEFIGCVWRRHSISMNQSASSANLTPSASMEVPLAVAVAFTGEQESAPALNDEVPDSSLRIAGVNEFPGSSEGTVAETPTTAKLENATDAVLPRTVAANSEPAAATQAKSRPPSDPPIVTTNSEPLAARKVESGPPTFMEQLGKGAYGIVFKVECNETKEAFAAKCVDKKALKRIRVGRFGNALQSVKKELNIWKRFKHRHIVVLREVIDTDGETTLCEGKYFSFELTRILLKVYPIKRGAYQNVLHTSGKISLLSVSATNTQLIRCCHSFRSKESISYTKIRCIIHRDIKPGNLLLKTVDDNEVILKIADFGVSHEMEHDNEDMRQTAGTAIFMAPEMLTGESFQGKPVDIWACGITLYMFVYGQPPFIAQSMTVLYGKIQVCNLYRNALVDS
ncbi:Calcium/calmodulin-dependent/calcium-dependent protein kinase [Phytophthora cactorum]|nr:Calcium/calmodulin-dependent/calcium-dependent protein kinase [Phytophthora cactorum]